MAAGIAREAAKYWWLRCVACSEASMTTQMRGFGLDEPAYEQAIHAFSGGFMHRGHACGLLSGAAVAAGFVARSRFGDDRARAAAALHAAMRLAKAYPQVAGSVNCREITGVSLTALSGRLRYVREDKGRACGHLHLIWAPEAHRLIDEALLEFGCRPAAGSCANCAVQTMRYLIPSTGLKAEDAVLVAGLAGGVGLHGNVCGALAAGLFAMCLEDELARRRADRDSRMRGSLEELAGTRYRGAATRLRLAFVREFGSELCVEIIGRRFHDAADHSGFVEEGGCERVTTFVAQWTPGEVQEKAKGGSEWS